MTEIFETGFCQTCRRNVEHYCRRRRWYFMIINFATFKFSNLGPWRCCNCETRSYNLARVRADHPTLSDNECSQLAGNFIRSERSLILRKKRTSRYSRKFRQGVVARLLSGKTTIGTLKTELSVAEADLLWWIQEIVLEKDEQIEELTGLLRSYHRAAGDLIGIASEAESLEWHWTDDGQWESRPR